MRGQELLPLLQTFALKAGSATVDLRQFEATLQKGQAQPDEVAAAAAELAGPLLTIVSTEAGKPRLVALPEFPRMALVHAYKQIFMEPTRPFPRQDTLPAPIPASDLVEADVKAQLGSLMETSSPEHKGIIKLVFPEGVDHLVVAQESMGVDLVEGAVAKLGYYLQNGKNAGYAESKLSGILRGSELMVRQSMEDVAVRPKKAASTVLTPSDFTFRFWTHLSNIILQDMRSKSERTDLDQGVCQSSYIVGYAVFHKKGAVQRERQLSEDRKSLEGQVRKAPFVFGFQELYDLKDDKGTTFISKHSRDFIHEFLKEKTTRTGEESLPYLVRVHAAAQKKDYFIQRDMLVPVFLRKVAEASEALRKTYLDDWTALFRQDETPGTARSDAAFRRDVEIRVKEGYPVLMALSSGSLLYLAGQDAKVSEQNKADLGRCFAVESILRPFDELLGLNRQELLKNVRMYLPFWLTVPVLSGILRIFRRMFHRRRESTRNGTPGEPSPVRAESAKVVRPAAATAPGAAAVLGTLGGAGAGTAGNAGATGTTGAKAKSQRASLLKYQRSIQSLVSTYVPAGSTIDATLDQLAEKWNPLYAAAQKQNLVEDVNSLVRDFLRPVRRSFLIQPPDLKRVHALAEQLSGSKSLAKIKKRDVLMRYIELYMIRCLQVKQT
jgi:hypothetical protein